MTFVTIETPRASPYETYLKKTLRSKRWLDTDGREWFALTPEEMRSAISEARAFLAEFFAKEEEADRLAKEESDDVLLKPGDPEWSFYRNLLAAREREDTASYLRQLFENSLKLAIGTAGGLDGIATWRTKVVPKFDEAAFKAAEWDTYQRYVKSVRMREFRLT